MELQKFSQFKIENADLKLIKGGYVVCTINGTNFICGLGDLLACTIACDTVGRCGGCGEVIGDTVEG